MGTEFQFGKVKRVLEMNGGYSCTKNVNVLNMWMYCAFQNGCCFCSALSHVQLFVTPWTAACMDMQHPCPWLSSWVCPNACPLSLWCYWIILSSATPWSFCLQSLPTSRSLPISWLFPSGGPSIRASASVLSMNIQDWFPLGLIDLFSLMSKGFSRVFSSTTIQDGYSSNFYIVCILSQ